MKPLAKIALLLLALSTSACVSIYANSKPELNCQDASCRWNYAKHQCECTKTAHTGFWSFVADLFDVTPAPLPVDGQVK